MQFPRATRRAPRSCTRDEGRSLGAGLQEQASNHLKLLWSKARVVSVNCATKLQRRWRKALQDCLELKALFQKGKQPAMLRRQRIMDVGQNKRFQVISSLVEYSSQEIPSVRFVIYLLDFSEICKGREGASRERYQLTRREVDIVRCVSHGLTNDEIGEKLYISRVTVETH